MNCFEVDRKNWKERDSRKEKSGNVHITYYKLSEDLHNGVSNFIKEVNSQIHPVRIVQDKVPVFKHNVPQCNNIFGVENLAGTYNSVLPAIGKVPLKTDSLFKIKKSAVATKRCDISSSTNLRRRDMKSFNGKKPRFPSAESVLARNDVLRCVLNESTGLDMKHENNRKQDAKKLEDHRPKNIFNKIYTDIGKRIKKRNVSDEKRFTRKYNINFAHPGHDKESSKIDIKIANDSTICVLPPVTIISRDPSTSVHKPLQIRKRKEGAFERFPMDTGCLYLKSERAPKSNHQKIHSSYSVSQGIGKNLRQKDKFSKKKMKTICFENVKTNESRVYKVSFRHFEKCLINKDVGEEVKRVLLAVLKKNDAIHVTIHDNIYGCATTTLEILKDTDLKTLDEICNGFKAIPLHPPQGTTDVQPVITRRKRYKLPVARKISGRRADPKGEKKSSLSLSCVYDLIARTPKVRAKEALEGRKVKGRKSDGTAFAGAKRGEKARAGAEAGDASMVAAAGTKTTRTRHKYDSIDSSLLRRMEKELRELDIDREFDCNFSATHNIEPKSRGIKVRSQRPQAPKKALAKDLSTKCSRSRKTIT